MIFEKGDGAPTPVTIQEATKICRDRLAHVQIRIGDAVKAQESSDQGDSLLKGLDAERMVCIKRLKSLESDPHQTVTLPKTWLTEWSNPREPEGGAGIP